MRKLVTTSLLFVLLLASLPARASTATDFYLELLRRGTSEVDAGRYDTSLTSLRLAAFGLIDSIEHYETAQAYLAVALDKLGQQEDARRSALRILTAEGVERRFGTLTLRPAIRNAFAAVARKVLSPAEAAALTSASAPVPAPASTRTSNTASAAPAASQTQPSVTAPRQEIRTVPFSAPATPRKTPQRPEPAKPVAPSRLPAAAPAGVDVPALIGAADRALISANLSEARRTYREVLSMTSLDRSSIVRVAEGLYRARDFATALIAFRRLGSLRAGEEAYRYYIAVALYETADIAAAKRELAAALPFIEVTPDVQRYRAKIEGATR